MSVWQMRKDEVRARVGARARARVGVITGMTSHSGTSTPSADGSTSFDPSPPPFLSFFFFFFFFFDFFGLSSFTDGRTRPMALASGPAIKGS
mgnify:CR=1 FL=1